MKIRTLVGVCLLVLGTVAANDVAPSNAELEAMYDKAYRAFDAANYDEAVKQLDAIDARKPDLVESQNLRGVVYMRQGLFDKAEAALLEAQRLNPKFWNARFNLAEVPFLKKDWSEARKRFQELLKSNAAELQGEAMQLIQYKILLTYLLEGNETLADSILAKFELSPDTPAVHYANAAISLQHQKPDEAKNWVNAAEKNFSPQLNKLFAESLYEVGWLQKEPGQRRAAVQFVSPEEKAEKAKTLAKSTFDQAQQAYEQRDFDNAAKLADQADAAQPNQPAILNLRGAILLEQGKFDEAESFFKKALKADPKFREAQFNLADVPFRQGDFAKARERFQTLLRQIPGGEKNQASQLINFKIFMTYLLEGKDSRAQKMVEQFQFSGDTPALYYAQAAWEFKHNNPDKANDWVASARKIYPLGANAAYSSGFYDLGWLKSVATSSSPAPAAATVASAQNEIAGPAIEPSPIPGAEAKVEETAPQTSLAQATPVPGMAVTADTAQSLPKPAQALANSSSLSGSSLNPSPASNGAPIVILTQPTPAPALGNTLSGAPTQAPSPVVSPSIAAPTRATPATVLAPSNVSQRPAQPSLGDRLDRWTDPRTLAVAALLLAGFGIIAWVVTPVLRRHFAVAGFPEGRQPATGPQLNGSAEVEAPSVEKKNQFIGGPRRVSLQLKASEPALRRAVVPLVKRAAEPGSLPEMVPAPETRTLPGPPAIEGDEFEGVGPVMEQTEAEATIPRVAEPTTADERGAYQWTPFANQIVETPVAETQASELLEYVGEPKIIESPASAAAEREEAALFAGPEGEEPFEYVGEPKVIEPLIPTSEEQFVGLGAAEVRFEEPFEHVGEPKEIEPAMPIVAQESIAFAAAPEVEFATAQPTEAIVPISEPVAQGQPVPYQTVVDDEEAAQGVPFPAPVIWPEETSEIVAGATIQPEPFGPSADQFTSQLTTNETMPETLQNPTAPVVRTPAPGPAPSQPGAAAQAPAAGAHTAVQITLSCEIASMQLTPTFKMGALQLRPISKVVSMRLASPQQQQQGMNLQVNFEISKVQPAPGSLGQIRLSPSQQQRPPTITSPSFNISGLQLVSGFEAAPVQLTPSQQGQASVHLTAAFHIGSVEFSPTFEVAGIILNSTSKLVSVQLPGAGPAPTETTPTFEIANVQLTSNGEIGMLQLNPVTPRRG